jgi:GNAT superfamily N-acetyltransferase
MPPRTIRARPAHLPGIQVLLSKSGKMTIDSHHINHRDIAVVTELGGEVIGFLWVGLMAKNAVGYVDKFAVDPAFQGHGVGSALTQLALTECKKRGVREVHGFIKADQYQDASAMNALKMALSSDGAPYIYVRGQINVICSELSTIKEAS